LDVLSEGKVGSMLKMSLLNPPSYSLIYGLAAIAKSSLQYFEQKYLTGSKRKIIISK